MPRNYLPPEVIPAAVAAGAGLVGMSAIQLFERRQRDVATIRMRATFPIGIRGVAGVHALASLSGGSHGTEFSVEVAADAHGITHAVELPERYADSLRARLMAGLSGLRLDDDTKADPRASILAVRLFISSKTMLRDGEPEAAGRALLAGLAGLVDDEAVVVRWTLRTSHAPTVAAGKNDDPAFIRALRKRQSEPGFRISGIVLVKAASIPRARALAEHVAACLRSRKALGAGIQLTYERSGRPMRSVPKVGRRNGWLTAAELVPLLGWPLGDQWIEGVPVGASREIAASSDIKTAGRFLFTARDRRGDRAVAVDHNAARLHSLIVGPTGAGKSTIIARGVLDDLAAGHGGFLADAKGDLIEDIIDRVPDADADRVVVVDPAAAAPIPGLQVFGAGDPDLRADVLVGALRSIFGADWGVRSESYGRLAIRTLAELPGASLLDFGRLFSDDAFRRKAMARQSDPLTVAAWQAYEGLSSAEQVSHIQAPMSRVMGLLSRPAMRMVLAQPMPKVDLGQLLAERKWILLALSPGTLGEPAARLLGALSMFLIWSALEARVSLPAAKRHPVFVVIDEFQMLADLPMSIEHIAERARGLGGGLVLGTQTVSRMPDSTRRSILGNFSTVISFRAGADEAGKLAREFTGLSADDLQRLGSYEVAARVATGDGGQVRTVTGRTLALPPTTGNAARIRTASAERYGTTREVVDAHLRGLVGGPEDDAAIGRARRQS